MALLLTCGVVLHAAAADEGPASGSTSLSADRAASAPARDATEAPLKAELLKTGLYLVTGGGSNSLIRLSAAGSILIDGKLPGQYRPLMSLVRRLSRLGDLPMRLMIATDHHLHHAGNYSQFVGAGVAVMVQQNAMKRLPATLPGAASSTSPPAPTITFDREYHLRMGGIELRVFHFRAGHTDNDAVVHFPDMKVIAVGDLMAPDFTAPDIEAGGSFDGWRMALAEVLKLDFDIVVPSVGPVGSRDDLIAFKSRLDALWSRASALIDEGATSTDLAARLQSDNSGWRIALTVEQADRLYMELMSHR